SVGVLLIEPADDVRRNLDERPQRRRRLDAVLAAVPPPTEDQRDLLEVVHEELPDFFMEIGGPASKSVRREQLLELLCQRGLRHAAPADAEQLDLVVERRIFAVV